MATLGMPWEVAGCDCVAAATGSSAMRNGIIDCIGSPRIWLGYYWLKSTLVLFQGKKIVSSEALNEKVPRLRQPLLPLFRIGNDAGHHQHARHTGEQQPALRQ